VKALLLTREYPPDVYGGAGVHVAYLARELSRRIPVEVRTFGDQDVRDDHLAVRGHGPAAAGPGDAAAAFLPALQALRVSVSFAAAPVDADVVHCHTWYAQFGGLLVRTLYGIPLVVTAHSLEPLRPWKREQLGRGADLSAWIERTAIESADAVIAVSREMRDDIVRHFRVPPDRVHVIPNGIDVAEYRPVPTRARLDRHGIDAGRPYVLFVGRISRQKGLRHLLRALGHLHPEIQLVLCAGAADTPEVLREVEAAVRRAQAERGHVVWIREMVDRETAVELYSHAAVFCCPSIYEPFGIINLEAMACETPVVASAVGGIPEVVVDGETGYLVRVEREDAPSFEPRDPERFARDLADRLSALLADPPLRKQMGARGRQRAETFFSWGTVAERVLALYRALTGRDEAAP
jgi:glycogen synthase